MQGAQVRFLVREQRFHMLPSQIKAIKNKQTKLGEKKKKNGSDQLEEFGNKPVQTRVIRGRYGLNWWHFECIVAIELTECADDEIREGIRWRDKRRVQNDSGVEPKQ